MCKFKRFCNLKKSMYIHAQYSVNFFFYKNKSLHNKYINRGIYKMYIAMCTHILHPNLKRFEFIHLQLDLTTKFITDVINLTFHVDRLYILVHIYI